jgi:hypothetical protein
MSCCRASSIPPLEIGFFAIDLAANLPARRVGVPAIGVTVELAPNPPVRPSAVSQTLMFRSPDDAGAIQVQLGPRETLEYSLSTFAVLAAGRSVQRYDGPPRRLHDTWLQLQPADFPVDFAHLSGTPRLLALADIRGSLGYTIGSRNFEQSFALNYQNPDTAVAVPRTATGASITAWAVPKDGNLAVALQAMKPSRIRLDLTSFPEYGPHTLSINCNFSGAEGLLVIDLLPEDEVESAGAISTLYLTPAKPSNSWGYVASSPFHWKYRYRCSGASGAAAGPWSAPLSPLAPLILNEDGSMRTVPTV